MADCRNIAAQQGFAGVFKVGPDHCEWVRIIDLHPPGSVPDAGRLFWRNDVLVEEGIYEPYVEHWHRDAARRKHPCAALALQSAEDGRWASLLRVGDDFSFACDRQRPLIAASLAEALAGAAEMAAAHALIDLEISQGRIEASGWCIARSSLPFRTGRSFKVEIREPDRLSLTESGIDADDGVTLWRITGAEGDISLFWSQGATVSDRLGADQPADPGLAPFLQARR